MISTPAESALTILVPEAEPLVKAYRDQFDPSAADGVPAHVTVLYPFMPPAGLTPAVSEQLAALFAQQASFDYALAELRRFPSVLYLAVEPDAPFRTLTRRVAEAFPSHPPYGGAYADVVPHLTLAQLPDRERLEQITADFNALYGPRLPLRLRAEAVVLMDNGAGAWRVRSTFRLVG